ncbi:unnamed protein product [Colletotrichum noveboracense]|uniref:Metallo-beta-lactamase domain-containing protein n=1 Tax=Colletotrichum noveboracense TaxID=2664923 RepID=A0A9W4RHE4_9PEZI|nr:unnamed protein product [Colletotrichum noveboracense]
MKAFRPHLRLTSSTAGQASRSLIRPVERLGVLRKRLEYHASCAPHSSRTPITGACDRALLNSITTRRTLSTIPEGGVKQSSTSGDKGRSAQSPAQGQPVIHDLFETKTGTWQYVVADPSTREAVVIDPVLDYDRETQVISTVAADQILSLAKSQDYTVVRILETHAHADHLTAASYLQHRLESEHGHKPTIGIGRRIGQVQSLFGQRYGVPQDERQGAFDTLFEDDEVFSIGNLQAVALHLPGHTPDHLGYKIGDNVFCGDSLFHVDIGTARCDFPGGSAKNLYYSGRRLLSLPDHVKIWTGHDYPPEGRADPLPWMTVHEHRAQNKHLRDGITEEEFVAQRKKRDASLGEPKLLHQSLQTNIRAGRLPKPTESGHRMLRLPLKLGGVQW